MDIHTLSREQLATASKSELESAYFILDYAVSQFQSEMFYIAAQGGHAVICSFLSGGECNCYKAQIPKSIKQLLLGRIVSEAQYMPDKNQMEFNNA